MLLRTVMYKIRLEYTARTRANPFSTGSLALPRDKYYEDVLTQTACTKLLVNHNIHTTQSDHCTIEFESDRDRTLALVRLSTSSAYTARLLD
jgi:hypothetical protein